MNTFYPIKKALEEIKRGKMAIIVDDPSRENQGDLFFPAETVTAQKINFMMKECRGLICVPLTQEYAVRLDLPLMVRSEANTEQTKVNFTISVDAKSVTSFGISAHDRAKTVKAISTPTEKPADFVRPGHVFPLVASSGGILKRQGHTEAAVELCFLTGFTPCGVICEILDDHGEPAKLPILIDFAKKFSLPIVSIADLLQYRKNKPKVNIPKQQSVMKISSSSLPTKYGVFQLSIYKSLDDSREHAVLHLSNGLKKPILTRIHSQCLTGDTFQSLRCDCHEQLHQSIRMVQEKGEGVIIYLNQEGRGIGLANKIKSYALQEKGYDTVEANHMLGFPADARTYGIAVEILKDLGISEIDLLTNNPEKERQLSQFGIHIRKTIPLETQPNGINKAYLVTKRNKLGHRLSVI